MTPSEAAWGARWSALVDADYHEGFGLETQWRALADDWGYNLNEEEIEVLMPDDGKTYKGRVFSIAGLVIWRSDAAEVIGWPEPS